jgi:hypothetical protein
MLYDRIKWHYDENLSWSDEDAVKALIPTGQQRTVSRASGFRYDITDHAEFQRPDPQWKPPPGLRGMVVRCTDGVYREPSFATDFRIMDGLLEQGLLDYVMWYVLPNPNVSNQRMIDAIAGQMRDSGVTWGRKGHGWSIDDEPTPYHAQVTGQTMVDLRNALQDIYQREELHYVGLYNGNYGFIENQGWQLWAPWPTSNGALPSWTTNLVMQQWGVAAAGEVPGFPNRPVDVDHIWDVATLDRLTGRTASEEDDLTPDQAAKLDFLFSLFNDENRGAKWYNAAISASKTSADAAPVLKRLTDVSERINRELFVTSTGADNGRNVFSDTSAGLSAVLKAVGQMEAQPVDVDALAKALAPLLNSGADAHAVALEVADVLGDRLSTGGTPSGPQ